MLSLALCVLSLSAAPKVEVRPAPIFLVLKTASTPTQQKREARLHDEVSLLLDNFAVLSQPVDDPAFASYPLAQQLKHALELANHNEALGVLWLAEPSHGQLMVHVVGIGTGRALIRTLEFDQRSSSEKALALIVRELLGTAFLQAAPETIDPGLAEVVRGVRRQLPNDPALEKPVEPPPSLIATPATPWQLSGAVVSGLALAGAQGRWLSIGARVRAERSLFVDAFTAGLVAEVYGARDLETAAQVTSLEMPVGLTAAWAAKVADTVVLVPRLAVLAGWNRLWATNPTGSTVSSVWTLRTRAALGGWLATSGSVKLFVEWSVDLLPLRGGVRDVATGADVWKAPLLELNFAAGLVWKG